MMACCLRWMKNQENNKVISISRGKHRTAPIELAIHPIDAETFSFKNTNINLVGAVENVGGLLKSVWLPSPEEKECTVFDIFRSGVLDGSLSPNWEP